ncbi:MAG TPA: hypothetical protein VN924_32005 [Bryobacteraceae bacterium]|nr:hypothetical protein [Bryobacteraceae bacterium]
MEPASETISDRFCLPFFETLDANVRLAGKKESEPEFTVPFRLDSSDEDEDPFGQKRQFVAQLLLLYLTRESDSLNLACFRI